MPFRVLAEIILASSTLDRMFGKFFADSSAPSKLIFSLMLKTKMILLLLLFQSSFIFSQTYENGKQVSQQYDTHLVVKGETLYSLSKKYSTTVPELLRLNPAIVDNNLETGSLVKVPFVPEQHAATAEMANKKMENAILYRVGKKETLYSISKRYNTDVATLMLWNDLQEASIQEGSQLIVGYENPQLTIVGPLGQDATNTGQPEAAGIVIKKPDLVNDTSKSVRSEPAGATPMNSGMSEKGIARWVKSSADDGNFYALHRTAPNGTMVTVKNMMNGRTVDVKVIGKLPATPENENVTIKISASAAKKLGVLDEKFLAEFYYDAEGEEK
jgi:LysM repeat protein